MSTKAVKNKWSPVPLHHEIIPLAVRWNGLSAAANDVVGRNGHPVDSSHHFVVYRLNTARLVFAPKDDVSSLVDLIKETKSGEEELTEVLGQHSELCLNSIDSGLSCEEQRVRQCGVKAEFTSIANVRA